MAESVQAGVQRQQVMTAALVDDLNDVLQKTLSCDRLAARLELFEIKQELVKIEQHIQRVQAMALQASSECRSGVNGVRYQKEAMREAIRESAVKHGNSRVKLDHPA